jgi:predicted transposase YdaD
MGRLYDITKDYLYQEGLVKGKHQVVVNLLRKGTVPVEEIAEFTGVPVEEVRQIAGELGK